jgi:ATP-binding cassette subfamily B multidrug efflux pump
MSAGEAKLGKAYDMDLVRRLWPYLRQQGRLLWIAMLLVPLTICLELAQPYVLKVAITDHIAVGKPAGLELLALAMLGLILAQAASSYVEQWAIQLLGQRAMHRLRLDMFDHVLAQRVAYFDRMPVGRLMTRMTNDIESINEMFAQGVVTLFADFVKMIAIIVIMLTLSVQLTLLTALTFPLLILLVNYARRAMRRSFREIRVRLAAMNSFAQEHLSGLRVIQLMARQDVAGREYDQINAGHRDAYKESIKADAAMYALVEAISVLAIALVAWLAARGVGADARATADVVATVGLVAVFIEYLGKFFIPIRDLSAKYAVMQGAMAALERITELLDTSEPDAPPLPAPETPPAPGTEDAMVAFDDVRFGYGAEQVLRGVTFAIPRGSTVAVVGATGSGKSTLIKLLTRLYERDAGAIRLAGADIRTLPVQQLRQRVTVVSQDVFLFAGTIADNVRLDASPATITDAEVQQALDRVGLTALLARRAGDTSPLQVAVTERGGNLSAGERQLLAFARALVRAPDVLVLDEATAHVDPEAEKFIEAGVKALMSGRTTLVIAHRLSTIRGADQIVVMERGEVVERGTHDTLVAAGGAYATLERTFRRGAEA